MYPVLRLSLRTVTAAIAICLVLFSLESSAIGPQDQLINPTFDPVVRILYNNPGNQDAGDGYMNGTGTIIDYHDVNGTGVFCVLTADHVVSTTGRFGGALVNKPGIAFGNSAKDSGNSVYTPARSLVRRNGANGTSDYAVLSVPFGPYNPAYESLPRTLIPASAFFYFSDIGYGNEGHLVDQFPPAGNDGYQSQAKYGIERYMNDKIDTFATQQANFTAIGYTYMEAAIWHIDDPAAAGSVPGSGTTYDADSGSPYFSSEGVLDPDHDYTYFTDNQFAVHTGTNLTNNPPNSPAGYKAYGVENFGVALTQADINWINQACESIAVPEPASLSLLLIGTLMAASLRRRS